jgi:predicted nucleic acid-binding protein
MSVKAFLDTNILIYVYSQDETIKQQQAIACTQQEKVWISTQVLNETINVLRRKFLIELPKISDVVDELTQQLQIAIVSPKTIQNALILAQRYQYQYFDSLILASALEVGFNRLYSEDLQDGQIIDNELTIINPFREKIADLTN